MATSKFFRCSRVVKQISTQGLKSLTGPKLVHGLQCMD